MASHLFRSRALPVAGALLVSLSVVLVYGGTLQVPWYFDDNVAIVENPTIRTLGEAWHALLQSSRGLAIFSFALNYRFGSLDVAGYHLVNIVIHLVTSLLVYALLRRFWPDRLVLALGGALIFAVHPLQTQAVTYIVQRMTCLSGLFFFLAILLFLRAQSTRRAGGGFCAPHHCLPYGTALLAGLLAMSTKENAATLPVVLLLVSRLVPSAEGRERGAARFFYLLPFFVLPAYLVIQRVLLPLAGGASLSTLGATQAVAGMRQPQPLEYLCTEFSVYWAYLRLFFLPMGQALDHGYPVVSELWNARSLLALAGLAGLATAAWRVRRSRPLVTLGIGWFFATLAVESTIIPLDPMVEHRMYVPLFGLVLATLDLLGCIPLPAVRRGAVVLAITLLATLALQRNSLWSDPVAFYEANLKVAPHNERVAVELAKRYVDADRAGEAEPLLWRALEINPTYELAYANLSNILIEKGEYQQARNLLDRGLVKAGLMSSELLVNFGTILDLMGEPLEAERVLRRAIAVDPLYAKGYVNLGAVMAREGRWEEAIGFYRQALELFPEQAITCFNLGVAHYNLGHPSEARDQFRRAMELSPRDADALFNFGMVSAETGDAAAAAAVLPKLYQLDAAKAQELEAELGAAGRSAKKPLN